MGTVTYLDRPIYTMAQVDGLLDLPAGTARRWIDGYRRGKKYPPIIRPEPTGESTVTWGEFVEASYLARFRSKIPLVTIRPVVDGLRRRYGVRYPLAHFNVWAGENLRLIYDLQVEAGIDHDLYAVDAGTDQLYLLPPARAFIESADFEAVDPNDRLGAVVSRIYPEGREKFVTIDPRRRGGLPVVRAVPTEVIAELYRAGDPIEDIQEWYDLPQEMVLAALSYEHEPVAA